MAFQAQTTRTGDDPVEFGRVSVLLGANGTGKSKLLTEIRSMAGKFLPEHKILNIEGGRALTMYDHLQLDARNFNQYKTYDQTFQQYSNKRAGTLQSRLFDGLKSLEQLSETKRIEHSDLVTQWLEKIDEKSTVSEVPRRSIDPMDRVFEAFNDIFPTISLSYYPNDKRLRCKKGDARYGPTSLSDGEKQVFSILVDVVELAEEKTILFVDEPELNLNPGLANRLWGSIESMLPNSIFLYATHSVSFAMRDSVESLFVISNIDENIQRIDNLDELGHFEQVELLGNVTSLLSNRKSLLVEGQDESFDQIFYDWILQDKDISTTAVGGCEDVIAILKRSGKWSRISPNVQIAGVIDRDYKSQKTIDDVSASGSVVLRFHEAESYLSHPEIALKVAEALGTADPLPTRDSVIQCICEFVSERKIEILARRVSAQLNVRLGVSVPSKALRKVESRETLKKLLEADVRRQKDVVEKLYEPNMIDEILSTEMSVIDGAIAEQNVESLLNLAPGKELLSKLSGRLGCVDGIAVVRAARRHLSVSDFQCLEDLRSQLKSKF